MQFSSTIFLFLFLPLVLLIYYILPLRVLKNTFLFLASILFYAFGEPRFVLVMLLSIVINYGFALLISVLKKHGGWKRFVLIFSVVANLSIIFIYKYLGFFVSIFGRWIPQLYNLPEIALPIGISFFTFQAMSYVIDVYRGEQAQKNPLNVGLYIALFPQLIAGPIVRYNTIAKQINDRRENINDFSDGVCRFIVGFSKKILLANTFAILADNAFATRGAGLSVSYAWLGIISYALQIFFDFSAYSDMAIGLGHMFGFHFLENFNYPYISTSVTDFWRRWHISLSTWFRDYLYIPLGGSRVSKPRLVFNLFIVWLLTGVWHGANWTFILWGLYYFALLTVEKLFDLPKKIPKVIGFLYTTLAYLMGWVLFRAEDLPRAGRYFRALFGQLKGQKVFSQNTLNDLGKYAVFFAIGIIACTPIIPYLKKKLPAKWSRVASFLLPVALMALLVASVTYLVRGVHNPFIYFNF